MGCRDQEGFELTLVSHDLSEVIIMIAMIDLSSSGKSVKEKLDRTASHVVVFRNVGQSFLAMEAQAC